MIHIKVLLMPEGKEYNTTLTEEAKIGDYIIDTEYPHNKNKKQNTYKIINIHNIHDTFERKVIKVVSVIKI